MAKNKHKTQNLKRFNERNGNTVERKNINSINKTLKTSCNLTKFTQ